MDDFLTVLQRIAAAFGPVVGFLVLGTIVGGFLIFLYLLLHFGDKAVKLFFPFIKSVVQTLNSERDNSHPAIRLEYSFHIMLLLIFCLCLLAQLVHALIPWRVQLNETLLNEMAVSCFVVMVILGAVSFKFASRL